MASRHGGPGTAQEPECWSRPCLQPEGAGAPTPELRVLPALGTVDCGAGCALLALGCRRADGLFFLLLRSPDERSPEGLQEWSWLPGESTPRPRPSALGGLRLFPASSHCFPWPIKDSLCPQHSEPDRPNPGGPDVDTQVEALGTSNTGLWSPAMPSLAGHSPWSWRTRMGLRRSCGPTR